MTDRRTTVTRIMGIEDDIYTTHGVNSRPGGARHLQMVKDIAAAIMGEPGLLESITPDVLEDLTAHNFHTGRQGAELALAGGAIPNCNNIE